MIMKILSGCIVLNEKKEIFLLWRNKHPWYETPGGKIDPEECFDVKNPTIPELQHAAIRELNEEVKGITCIREIKYFGSVNFQIPDKREATAHKFIVYVEGNLSPNEDIFDAKKSRFFSISELKKQPLSRDLSLLLEKIQLELNL